MLHEVASTSIARHRTTTDGGGTASGVSVSATPIGRCACLCRRACLLGRSGIRPGILRRHHTRIREVAHTSVRGGRVSYCGANRRRSAVATQLTIRVAACREVTVAVDRAAVVFGAELEHVVGAGVVGPCPWVRGTVRGSPCLPACPGWPLATMRRCRPGRCHTRCGCRTDCIGRLREPCRRSIRRCSLLAPGRTRPSQRQPAHLCERD